MNKHQDQNVKSFHSTVSVSKMKRLLILLILTVLVSCQGKNGEDMLEEIKMVYNLDRLLMLRLINEQRTARCKCGNTEMPPAPKLKWYWPLHAKHKSIEIYRLTVSFP